MKAEVEKITLDDVKRVANKYFADKPSVLAIVRPRQRPRARASEISALPPLIADCAGTHRMFATIPGPKLLLDTPQKHVASFH